MNAKFASLSLAAALALFTLNVLPVVAGPAACPAGTIRIVHTYTDRQGGTPTQHMVNSLGTAVGPHVVLTHNHFVRRPEPGRGETLTIVECSGETTRLAVDQLAFVAVDAGTALIYLPDNVSLAGAVIADRKVVAVGTRLSVHFWDDAAGAFAERRFAVISVREDALTLADPDRTINPGDSGGGVFLNGALVANIRAIYTDLERGPIGQFDVALLPAGARRLLAETAAGPAAGAQ